MDLTLAIVAINGFNRLATSFRTEPGSYPGRAPSPAIRKRAERDGRR